MFPSVRFLSVLALTAIPLTTAQTPATTPEKKHSLSLDVRSVAAGASRTNSGDAYVSLNGNAAPMFGTSATASSFTRTSSAASSTTLQIDVRNLSRIPDEVTVEWYFFARAITGVSQGRMIHDQGASTLTLEPVVTKKVSISSKPVTRTNMEEQSTRVQQVVPGGQWQNYTSGSRKREGAKPAGWIVRLLDKEQVIAVRASEPSLEALAKSSNQLTRLIPPSANTQIPGGPGFNGR